MVIERELLPFTQWLLHGTDGSLGALVSFLLVIGILALLVLLVTFAVGTVRYGPMVAGDKIYRVASTGAKELFMVSPRRVLALARLAVHEAFRKRILIAVALFILILLFAGWFLRTDDPDAGRLFIGFVLAAIMYLVLGIALLISAFSLPQDIKSKTIHTVVTKPVRAGEIVLGRFLGYTIVGTILLSLMGVSSYFFVIRSLDHSHQVEASSLKNITNPQGKVIGKSGRTSQENGHRHLLNDSIDKDGTHHWHIAANYHHTHAIIAPQGSEAVPRIGAPHGYMVAKVPQSGKIRFIDRNGGQKSRGISVGNEWEYRSFIDGNTPARAIWTFKNIDQAVASGELQVELLVRVFRSYQGNINTGIYGQMELRKPGTSIRSKPIIFQAKDNQIARYSFKRKLKGAEGEELDLLKDLTNDNGEIELWVKCLDAGQYFGFAQADCYLYLSEASPIWNYCKALISLWVQMVIVIAIGVTCSTLVSGPIAVLFTAGFIFLGFFKEDFLNIALSTNFDAANKFTGYQTGPIEAMVRIWTGKNILSPLPDNFGTTLVKNGDKILGKFMWAVAQILPDFPRFNTFDYVASGFNIPGNQIGQDLLICLAYMVGLYIAGYFLLRTREVAK